MPFSPLQTLDEDFRVDYCNLWMALLKPDKDEIRRICTKMGVGELFGLFACIVTARSWESVTKGITRVRSTAEEVSRCSWTPSNPVSSARPHPGLCGVADPADQPGAGPDAARHAAHPQDQRPAPGHRAPAGRVQPLGRLPGGEHLPPWSVTPSQMSRQCSLTVYEYRMRRAESLAERLSLSVRLYATLAQILLYRCWLWTKELLLGE